MLKRVGKQVIKFEKPPIISSYSSIVGKKEGEGPLADTFDTCSKDNTFGKKTWEKAESQMQKQAYSTALQKSDILGNEIDFIFAGDLLNQCTSSAFAHRESNIPYFGLYGACSTMAEGLVLSAMMLDGGFAQNVACIASSHFCSAERQYRFPLEYGGQRTPSSQWTVTGSGAIILTNKKETGIKVTNSLVGKIVDLGITDQSNMGSAMAPAAYSSFAQYFKDTNTSPSDYDLIATGDLGFVGAEIFKSLLLKDQIDISKNYVDCGILIFDREKQDVHAGGSGCGCSAAVLCSYILNNMQNGTFKKVLFAGTGALLSPTSVLQGESIAGICHIACLEI